MALNDDVVAARKRLRDLELETFPDKTTVATEEQCERVAQARAELAVEERKLAKTRE